MKEVRVAHVTTVDMSLHLLLLNQLKSIEAAGYDVTGISTAGPHRQPLEEAGIRHIPVAMTRSPFTPIRDLRSLWKLYRVFRRERFTIVHTHNPKPSLLGQLAARLARVPVVVNTVHGFYFSESTRGLRRWFYMFVEKVAGRCSDAVLSQNPEDVETAVKEHIAKPERISLLGNGIDLTHFDPARVDRVRLARLRDELGIRRGVPVVGFVGRLVREKGILELLDAAERVCDEIPEACFLVVGPYDADKEDAVSPEAAVQKGVESSCRFVGYREDLRELYALMDVLVLPSHREGFPRAPMEASAMGVPCIATDIRGCREAVVPGRNGALVPVRDPGALAAAIIELLSDRETLGELGREAVTLAAERFDEREVFEKVESTYARLLRDKGLGSPPVATHHSIWESGSSDVKTGALTQKRESM